MTRDVTVAKFTANPRIMHCST